MGQPLCDKNQFRFVACSKWRSLLELVLWAVHMVPHQPSALHMAPHQSSVVAFSVALDMEPMLDMVLVLDMVLDMVLELVLKSLAHRWAHQSQWERASWVRG